MKMLLMRETGRAVARRGGGIYRSGVEIARSLSARGWQVHTHRVQDPLEEVPEGCDVAWFYGGTYEHVDQAVKLCTEAGVPLVINSSYNPSGPRVKNLIGWWERWGRHPLVFFGVWAHPPLFDPRLEDMAPQLVFLPKILRLPQSAGVRPFKQRTGFAMGDLVKMQMPDMVRGLDVQKVVSLLRERWPDEPVFFIEQHRADEPVYEGATLVPYQNNIHNWLGQRRLFISLVVNETFAMVPMEAQTVGTPVIYRHMPQSLTETVGQSGLMYRDEHDLIDCVEALMSDSSAWDRYSRAGQFNVRAHQHYDVGMDIALRNLIRRARREDQ